MARPVTVCIDTNVLLGFFNNEPDKVESCSAFFQLLFTRRIKSVVEMPRKKLPRHVVRRQPRAEKIVLKHRDPTIAALLRIIDLALFNIRECHLLEFLLVGIYGDARICGQHC